MRPLRTPSGHTERLTWDISPEDCPLTPVPVRWFDRTRSLNSVSALRGSYWLGSLAGSNLFIYVFRPDGNVSQIEIYRSPLRVPNLF